MCLPSSPSLHLRMHRRLSRSGPSRTGGCNDQDMPERLDFRIVKFKQAIRLIRIASEEWERLESQRPALIHRGVTTKTTKTLDTAKPACLLSDRQRPPLLIPFPLWTLNKEPDPPAPPILNLLASSCTDAHSFCLECCPVLPLAIHIPDRRLRPGRHSQPASISLGIQHFPVRKYCSAWFRTTLLFSPLLWPLCALF